MRPTLMLACVALLCLIGTATGHLIGKRSLPMKGRKNRGNHGAFRDIESYVDHSIVISSSVPSVTPKESSRWPLLTQPVSAETVQEAEQKVLAVDELHPHVVKVLDNLQLDEIGHSSLDEALHELSEAAADDPSTLSFLSYELYHRNSQLSSALSSIAQSKPQLIGAVQRVISALSGTSSLSEQLRSIDDALTSSPSLLTNLVIVETVAETNLTDLIMSLEEDDQDSTSIVSYIRSLIAAEESDVELQSALSSLERHKQTEPSLISQLYELEESSSMNVGLGRKVEYGHSSTYQLVERVVSLASSEPELFSELSSIESFEQAHSAAQRYVQSLMSADDTSALASVENVVKQNELETCSCAVSVQSQLASFVDLEIAYPYLAQDIVMIHKAKVAHSSLSAALEYIGDFGDRHARLLSEISFDQAHRSDSSGHSQLLSLQAQYPNLFEALQYVSTVESSYQGLSTALSVVSMIKLANPTVVAMVEYVVHQQSSEMSAAQYIGSLVSSRPLILDDVYQVESYLMRYPHLATYEEIVSSAYATEPTDVHELQSAISSPSEVSDLQSLDSIERSEPSLWSAVQYTQAVRMRHNGFGKAAKSLITLDYSYPSAVQQIIFEEEMDSSLVTEERRIASVKMRHPDISHDMYYVDDLALLNSGLYSALSSFTQAERTSPTVLDLMIQALSYSSQLKDSQALNKQVQQHPQLFHALELLTQVTKNHPGLISAYSSVASVQSSSPDFLNEFQLAESLTDSTVMSNLASIEVVQSSHPSFISDAKYLLHEAAQHQQLMSAFNSLETAQVSSPSTVYYFISAARNRTTGGAGDPVSSYLQELVESYSSLWTKVEYLNQLGNAHPLFAHDLDEVLSIVKSHPHIVNDLLSIEAGTNPSVTAAEKLGVEEEQSLCQTTAVPRVQEVEEEIVEPKPKFVSTFQSSYE